MASTGERARTRGPNKKTPWVRRAEDGLSVLRLPLDTRDPVQRARLEAMFSAAYSVRRAVQRDARDRTRAYWNAQHERARDPAAARERLGLSKKRFEYAAYDHVDAAPHLRQYVTKALAMHLADSVWSATERHLFRDKAGARHGMPGVSRWYDFTRLPGRARSHSKERTWETFRLCGSLAGHRAAYTGGDGGFRQPRRMRPIAEPARSWWDYAGPLAVVFSGLPGGTLVLPVRLPASPSNQPILDHHLADPERWHKIDLVRRQDPNAAGGWRYEAHLMVLVAPYVAPAVAARRERAAKTTAARRAGIDVNVSNITVASHARGRDLQVTRVERDGEAKARGIKQARRERRRKRALERSRRATNAAQYQLSKRQEKRARRREAAGLPPQHVIPAGSRRVRGDGKPLQAYRKDQLSRSYREQRAAQAADAASARRHAATTHVRSPRRSSREHGCELVIEDTDLRGWARTWGRALAAFSPGTLVAAIEREAAAVAGIAGIVGGVVRASTRTTALSQHCVCGARVAKTLGNRVHDCVSCGLRGDRDAVAATLAACVRVEPNKPASAAIDHSLTAALFYDLRTRTVLLHTLPESVKGRQDVPSESNCAFRPRRIVRRGEGAYISSLRGGVARRTVGMASRTTPDEPGEIPDHVGTNANANQHDR